MSKELEQYRGGILQKHARDDVLKTIGRSKEPFGVVLRGEVVVGFDITRRFFQRALRESAHQARTLRRGGRSLEIVWQYIETEDTLRDIGDRYGITHEAVRVTIRRELTNLWLNCSGKTQRLFPPEYIRLRKPSSLKRIRGGVNITVSRMLAEGKTIAEIREEIGAERLESARQVLRSRGIDVPFFRPLIFYKELASKLTWPNLSDIEIQELLSRFTKGFFEADRKRGHPLLTPVGHIISGCGFHYRNPETWHFINSFRTAGIPVGEVSYLVRSKFKKVIQRYYFIAARHTERARQVLENDPNLEKYHHSPVQQIYGPQSELPTTTQLSKKRGYIPTGQVFAELGIHVRGRARIKQKDVFTDGCPVPVFFYPPSSQFFCRREDTEILREFIRKSLGL